MNRPVRAVPQVGGADAVEGRLAAGVTGEQGEVISRSLSTRPAPMRWRATDRLPTVRSVTSLADLSAVTSSTRSRAQMRGSASRG